MRAVNLIPAEQRGGARVGAGRSEGVAYGVLVLAAGIAAMAVVYAMAHKKVDSRKSEAAALTAKAQTEQAAASQLAPYADFIALRQTRTQAVEQLVDSRFDWAHAFHEFGRVLPSNASITSLTGAIGSASTAATSSSSSSSSSSASGASAPAVTSVTPPGDVPTFTVAGCATSQAAVAQTINRLRLIDGVGSVTLVASTASGNGGGAGGGGGCTGSQPSFTLNVAFEPLPAIPSSTASAGSGTAETADTTGGAG